MISELPAAFFSAYQSCDMRHAGQLMVAGGLHVHSRLRCWRTALLPCTAPSWMDQTMRMLWAWLPCGCCRAS